MKLQVNERQFNHIMSSMVSEVEEEVDMDEQTESEPVSPEPEPGTSDVQTGAPGYPEVGKWESGVSRGPANQIGVTRWSDVVGSTLERGKDNQLK